MDLQNSHLKFISNFNSDYTVKLLNYLSLYSSLFPLLKGKKKVNTLLNYRFCYSTLSLGQGRYEKYLFLYPLKKYIFTKFEPSNQSHLKHKHNDFVGKFVTNTNYNL